MDTQSNEHKYEMTISLSILEHLGRGLYSNVPAVLSEVVANAWDADAENVDIAINSDDKTIVITDDGFGMTLNDINRRFLNIGYRKRADKSISDLTPRGRKPMGRKGIGKLSVFAIADTVEIHTVRDGERNAFRMDYNDIRKQIDDDPSSTYYPLELPPASVDFERGTTVILSKLRRERTPSVSIVTRRLARRFSIIGKHDFSVSINGDFISARDRDYQKFMQFVWHFGDVPDSVKELFPNANPVVLELDTFGQDGEFSISGWIGTVEKQEQIDEDTNGIVIFSRGKLVHENILDDMMQGGVWTKYVIGEIDAEFLDDNGEDIITSARQRLKQDDDRYIVLKEFLEDGVIRRISTSWLDWRRKEGAKDALSKRPNVKRWYELLGPDQQKLALRLFGKIEALVNLDETGKRELYKASMFAFERLAITDQLSILNNLETEADFERVSEIFGDLTELARVHYYSIAKVRVEIIKRFIGIVDSNKKERVIQKHIFNALWLLDPSWERAATNSRMEQSITREFKNMESKLSADERKGRIDIRYQTVTGKHVVIELKRYSVEVDLFDLLKQVSRYKRSVKKCLADRFGDRYEDIVVEVVCITGKRPQSPLSHDEEEKMKVATGVRCITYDLLIENALLSYNDYLEAEKRISDLVQIIESIDEDFDT